jgi:hypothetical protein
MQLLVHDPHLMIDTAVQCDVDGIPKGSHYSLSARIMGAIIDQ